MLYGVEKEIVYAQTRYFIGPGIEIESWKDKIDGELVYDSIEYSWLDGTTVGYEVITGHGTA